MRISRIMPISIILTDLCAIRKYKNKRYLDTYPDIFYSVLVVKKP